MRIREILPENWWKDLDPGFLSMMGYSPEEEATDLEDNSLKSDVDAVRSTHRAPKI